MAPAPQMRRRAPSEPKLPSIREVGVQVPFVVFRRGAICWATRWSGPAAQRRALYLAAVVHRMQSLMTRSHQCPGGDRGASPENISEPCGHRDQGGTLFAGGVWPSWFACAARVLGSAPVQCTCSRGALFFCARACPARGRCGLNVSPLRIFVTAQVRPQGVAYVW